MNLIQQAGFKLQTEHTEENLKLFQEFLGGFVELCMTSVAGREVVNQGVLVTVPIATVAPIETKRKAEKEEGKPTPKKTKLSNDSSNK